MPGAGRIRLIGPVGPGAYPGLSWPSSGPKALKPRWRKAGASKCSPAPSPNTKTCPNPQFRQYSPHAVH